MTSPSKAQLSRFITWMIDQGMLDPRDGPSGTELDDYIEPQS